MHLLDLIYPKVCVGCGKFGAYICPHCANDLKKLSFLKCPECQHYAIDGRTHPRCNHTYGLDGIKSFFPYTGIMKHAIKTVKYRFGYRALNDIFDCIPKDPLLDIFRYDKGRSALVIPMPLHSSRLRWRGFNQAELFGKLIAEYLHIPMQTDVLRRLIATIPQVETKTKKERLQNMTGVFEVDKHHMKKEHQKATVLLVDDVFTTGATLRSAASELKHAGFSSVWGVTIAQ